MPVDYNNFAKTFSNSRKNMKWEEVEYFFSLVRGESILDIWCWNGRLLESYISYFQKEPDIYKWVDISSGLIDEAKNLFPQQDFEIWDMLNIWKLVLLEKYENIFLIASFHHLESLEERWDCMRQLYSITKKWGYVFMTNWALDSSLNKEKYTSSQIENSENSFGSRDYSIKIWEYTRYYHSFSLSELEYLGLDAWFKIKENRIFEWGRNIITILEK